MGSNSNGRPALPLPWISSPRVVPHHARQAPALCHCMCVKKSKPNILLYHKFQKKNLSCLCVKIEKIASINLGNYLHRNKAKNYRSSPNYYIILFSFASKVRSILIAQKRVTIMSNDLLNTPRKAIARHSTMV